MTTNQEKDQYEKDAFMFIDRIANIAQNPSAWPLTPQEQAAFIRNVVTQARTMSNSLHHFHLRAEKTRIELSLAS